MSRSGIGSPLTSATNAEGRLQVDQGQTALFEGRGFKIKRKITMTGNQTLWFKFIIASPFELSAIAADVFGEVDITFYSAAGVDGGGWTEHPAWIIPRNTQESRPKIDSGSYWTTRAQVFDGGTFTPTSADSYIEIISINSGQATSGKVSIARLAGSETRRPASTFYVKFQELGNSSATITYGSEWDEE